MNGYTIHNRTFRASIQCRQSQIALNKLDLQYTSTKQEFCLQFLEKETNSLVVLHRWASSDSPLHAHRVHSHQPPIPIFSATEHILLPNTSLRIHYHPTKIKHQIMNFESKSSKNIMKS